MDKKARLWYLPRRPGDYGRPLVEYALPHSKPVYYAFFSPSGKNLYTVCFDRHIRKWSLESLDSLTQLSDAVAEDVECGFRPYSAASSPDGKILAFTAEEKTIEVWNMETMSIMKVLDDNSLKSRPYYDIGFSHKGDRLIARNGSSHIVIWQVSDWKITLSISRPILTEVHDIKWVSFLPQEHDVIVFATEISFRHILVKFNVSTKQIISHRDIPILNAYKFAISPDGKTLAITKNWGEITLWDETKEDFKEPIFWDQTPDGREVQESESERRGNWGFLDADEFIENQMVNFGAFAFSPTGDAIAAGNGHGDICVIYRKRDSEHVRKLIKELVIKKFPMFKQYEDESKIDISDVFDEITRRLWKDNDNDAYW